MPSPFRSTSGLAFFLAYQRTSAIQPLFHIITVFIKRQAYPTHPQNIHGNKHVLYLISSKKRVCIPLRRMKSPKKMIFLLFIGAFFLLTFPMIKSNLYKLNPIIHNLGERLALLSACTDLPGQSRILLEKRFSDEVLYPDEPEASSSQAPAPEASSQPDASVSPGEDAENLSSSSSNTDSASSASSESTEREEEAEESAEISSLPPADQAVTPPEIPASYRGDMKEEDLSGYEGNTYLSLDPGYLRNYTDLDSDEILEILQEPADLQLSDASQPQVLIYHTHATEAFERYDNIYYDTRNNWRSTDNNMNMVAVGEALAKALEENGINVIHDTTQHDYPSYNGAYERSAVTVQKYLDEYPSIQVLLDVHRDAIDRNGTLIRPVTTINGRKAAQLMIIAGCDDGTMDMPDWRENLRFATAIQQQAETALPHLMRPIFFCYRKYNLGMTKASLLLEFGSHGNTLEECIYTAQLAGESIAQAIHSYVVS